MSSQDEADEEGSWEGVRRFRGVEKALRDADHDPLNTMGHIPRLDLSLVCLHRPLVVIIMHQINVLSDRVCVLAPALTLPYNHE